MTYHFSITTNEAFELAYKTPENEYQRLLYAWCRTIVDTWSASCATDGYVDLRPYRDAEKVAKDAFEAYVNSKE